jgi:hypothetical protein
LEKLRKLFFDVYFRVVSNRSGKFLELSFFTIQVLVDQLNLVPNVLEKEEILGTLSERCDFLRNAINLL